MSCNVVVLKRDFFSTKYENCFHLPSLGIKMLFVCGLQSAQYCHSKPLADGFTYERRINYNIIDLEHTKGEKSLVYLELSAGRSERTKRHEDGSSSWIEQKNIRNRIITTQ